ncbi:hypothetical protein [Saccharothrix texasensis]|uniref:hypothetical protein n=1 Tax=Saccharothrix texasensis TaxID=103734 RepID=UPI000F4C05A4|nr:hypothetical protein [Saccharothrix texasensis]
MPHHVTDVLGGSPEDVGVALLVFVAGVAALAVVSGSLTDRCGPWPVAMSGSVVAALAAGLAGRGEAGFRAGVAVSTAVAVVAVGVLAAAEQR